MGFNAIQGVVGERKTSPPSSLSIAMERGRKTLKQMRFYQAERGLPIVRFN
jgi:hypothetical protein